MHSGIGYPRGSRCHVRVEEVLWGHGLGTHPQPPVALAMGGGASRQAHAHLQPHHATRCAWRDEASALIEGLRSSLWALPA